MGLEGIEALATKGRIKYPVTYGGSDINLDYIFSSAYGDVLG